MPSLETVANWIGVDALALGDLLATAGLIAAFFLFRADARAQG